MVKDDEPFIVGHTHENNDWKFIYCNDCKSTHEKGYKSNNIYDDDGKIVKVEMTMCCTYCGSTNVKRYKNER